MRASVGSLGGCDAPPQPVSASRPPAVSSSAVLLRSSMPPNSREHGRRASRQTPRTRRFSPVFAGLRGSLTNRGDRVNLALGKGFWVAATTLQPFCTPDARSLACSAHSAYHPTVRPRRIASPNGTGCPVYPSCTPPSGLLACSEANEDVMTRVSPSVGLRSRSAWRRAAARRAEAAGRDSRLVWREGNATVICTALTFAVVSCMQRLLGCFGPSPSGRGMRSTLLTRRIGGRLQLEGMLMSQRKQLLRPWGDPHPLVSQTESSATRSNRRGDNREETSCRTIGEHDANRAM